MPKIRFAAVSLYFVFICLAFVLFSHFDLSTLIVSTIYVRPKQYFQNAVNKRCR